MTLQSHMHASFERRPLTNGQLLMWTGQQMHSEAPLYNMVLTFDLVGRIDRDAFQAAFHALVDRCDALRTVIALDGGMPVQLVRHASSCLVENVDLSDAAEPDAALNDWVKVRARVPFDLGESLYDTALIALGPSRYVWYLNQHHLITDGWSVALTYRYMGELYERALAGTLSEAPALPQYKEYVSHEQAIRQSPRFERVAEFWRRKLAAPVAPVRLYGKQAESGSTHTTRYTCALGAERSRTLKELAGRPEAVSLTEHLSLFNLFATALFAYLCRVGSQRDLVVGTPSHNRTTGAFKETVGLFIEIFPLQIGLAEDETFLSLLRKVRNESNIFLRNARPGSSSSAVNRSYSVLLNYITVAFPPFAGIPMSSTWVHAGHGDARHHLRLQVHDFDDEGQFVLHFDFNDELFPEAACRAAMGHFLRILDAMLDDLDAVVAHVNIASADEQKALTESFGRSPVTYRTGGTVVERFESQVARTPEAVAVLHARKALTYSELNERANRLATRLRGHGVKAGQCVGLCLERSPDVLIGVLGILKSGGAYVPFDPGHPDDRLAYMLEEANSVVVVTQSNLATRVPERAVTVLVPGAIEADGLPGAIEADGLPDAIEAEGLAGAGGEPVVPTGNGETGGAAAHTQSAPAATDLAYVLYTSGSTGRPKGVAISHEALANYVCWAATHYVNDAPANFPLFTPLTFDLTVTSLFVPLVTGGTVVVYADAGNPAATVLQVFDDEDVDVVKLTPSHLRVLAGRDLSSSGVRALIVGGEDLKTDLAREIVASSGDRITIYNEYGPTEATVGCTVHRFDPSLDTGSSVPIGRPAAAARIYVLDERMHLAPPGVTGEIYVGGPGLAQGYLNRPDLSTERFVEAPHFAEKRLYRTGDLGRWRSDRTLEYLGRTDHQVKIRGVRIELGEIEAAMARHPDVREVVVDVLDGPGGLEEPVTYCIRCGLPSNYPSAAYNADGLCNLCTGFEAYEVKAQKYFRGMDELRALFDEARRHRTSAYDCLMLLSGGKDSTYALYQLVGLGLNVLAFTLDNGYISEGAKANVRRVTQALGVDHVFGETPAMKAIFADSLRRHSNVCNGCFKTIYTLGIQLALEKSITHIVTGLSRGQFFETRLTEELFWNPDVDTERIDLTILEARKAYHRTDDAVSRLLDVEALQKDELFERIRFVDFYRHCDVGLEEMLSFLDRHAPWIRPLDTGRSTNCLINDVGIYVHKLERGYHNYAFPYSWDVRMGHKTRTEALDELMDEIDVANVERMLAEVGYDPLPRSSPDSDQRMVAYYVSDEPISGASLRAHLGRLLPDAMIPAYYVSLDHLPTTPNGKLDRTALPKPDPRRPTPETVFVAPRTAVEKRVAEIWALVLKVREVGVTDDFLLLGGNSLLAIQIIARVNREFGIDLAIQDAFISSSVAELAALVQRTLLAEIEALPEDEAQRLADEVINKVPAA